MSELCCGLDIGTTNLKAVLVDDRGRVRWSRAVPAPRTHADRGPETDANILVRIAEDLIIEGWRAVSGGMPLLAIATSGIGEDGVSLDADLVPVAAAIPWFDDRARAEAAELDASEAATPRLGLAVDHVRTVAKWLWLSRHRPAAVGPGRTWVALTDYPAVAWSGRAFMSQSLATRTAAYDVYNRRWDAAMLSASHAPTLPPVVTAGTRVGSVLPGRLSEAGAADAATMLVAGGHDHPVAASFVRRFQPDAIVDSMGTAELLYGELADAALRPLDPRLAYSVPVLGGKGLSYLGVIELAAALEPFRRTAHGDLVTAFLEGEDPGAVDEPTATGIDPKCLDGLDRPLALLATARAVARIAHRTGDLIRATGAAGDVYATGGWSRSDRFLQMRARILERPVLRFEEDELTGAGAALVAWSALGRLGPALDRPAVTRFDPN